MIFRPGWGNVQSGAQVAQALYAPAAGGWWVVPGKTCVAAYQPKGAADLATSYVNLETPGTHDAAPGVAPLFNAATGWTFNGSTQYLTTGIVLATGSNETTTWIVRYVGCSDFGPLMGVGGAGSISMFPVWAGAVWCKMVNGNNADRLGSIASGIIALVGGSMYLNGLFDYAFATASVNVWGAALEIARNTYDYCATSIQAFAMYSDILSAPEVAALTTRMVAL